MWSHPYVGDRSMAECDDIARRSVVCRCVDDGHFRATSMDHDDILLVSSGRTIYEVAQAGLPRLAAVRVAPTMGE